MGKRHTHIPANAISTLWEEKRSGRRVRIDHVWVNQVQVHNQATGRVSTIRTDRLLREFEQVEG